jgi:hypothetical protein
MLLYHNVAKLRQFKGAEFASVADRHHILLGIMASGRDERGHDWENVDYYRGGDEFNPGADRPCLIASAAATEHLDVQITDFLAQSIAVDAEQIGSPDLIAAGCRQRHRQKRMLDLAQHPVIEAGRR